MVERRQSGKKLVRGDQRRLLLEEVAREMRVRPANLVTRAFRERERISNMVQNTGGKFRVLGVDRFEGSDWIAGEFTTAGEAYRFAQQQTKKARRLASDSSIADAYYSYTPDGEYIDRPPEKR